MPTFTKKIVLLSLTVIITMAFGAIDGNEIMKMVDERPDGDNSKSTMTMILINKRDQQRVRQIVTYSIDTEEGSKSLIYFTEPADVAGTAFLSWEYDDKNKDDQQWLYLPALKKARRISGSSENDYFMGSDFTYDDMGERSIDEDFHKLLKEENIDGSKCWVIESIPKDPDYMYSKRISWIRQDALISIRSEFYDPKGELLKTLLTHKIQKKDGFWTAYSMEMIHNQNNHRTKIETNDIEYNIEMDENMFSVSNLQRFRIR